MFKENAFYIGNLRSLEHFPKNLQITLTFKIQQWIFYKNYDQVILKTMKWTNIKFQFAFKKWLLAHIQIEHIFSIPKDITWEFMENALRIGEHMGKLDNNNNQRSYSN